MPRARVLSGVQPTGALHLGNWLGAIRNWVDLQDSHDTFFCVVDLHAITVPHDPQRLAADTRSTAALYLACGIDPAKATVFVQSHVAAHSELCWLLNCVTPLNWLERMIQFKEKALKQGDQVSVGLLDYPVLKVPEPLILKEGARVMSLTDGRSKMSKSDPNEGSRINLLDPPELITKKVKRAKTDPQMGLEFGNPDRPETDNLLGLYALLSGKGREAAARECAAMGWGTFKPLLAEVLVEALRPIQQRFAELSADPAELDRVLAAGRERASGVADATLQRARTALGFLPAR